MNATCMQADVLMRCDAPRVPLARPRTRMQRRIAARVALAALALAGAVAGAYGERWLLRDAPLPAFEYVVATCVPVAFADAPATRTCASDEQPSQGKTHE